MVNRKLFFTVALCVWIGFIFSFSLHDAQKSSVISNAVGQTIIENASTSVSNHFDTMSQYERAQFNKFVRKCGHFAEFFVLGVLMYLTVSQTSITYKAVVTFALCALVGAMDETIQLFVDGRAGRITDVLIDICGGYVGIMMLRIVLNIYSRIQKRKIENVKF